MEVFSRIRRPSARGWRRNVMRRREGERRGVSPPVRLHRRADAAPLARALPPAGPRRTISRRYSLGVSAPWTARGLRTHPWDLIRFTPAWGSEPPHVPACRFSFSAANPRDRRRPGVFRTPYCVCCALVWYASVFVVLGAMDTLLAALAYRSISAPPSFRWRCASSGTRHAGRLRPGRLHGRRRLRRPGAGGADLLHAVRDPHARRIPVLAVYLYNWAYALDDLLEGFKIVLIHHFPPGPGADRLFRVLLQVGEVRAIHAALLMARPL